MIYRLGHQIPSPDDNVKILGITAAVIIVILIIVGAWFIYTSLHDGRPEWLQTIPGLHYRPINEKVENLISYRGPEESSYKPWVAVIDKFLEEYSHPRNNVMICDFDKFPQEDYFCEVNLKDFGYCKKENLYGYNRQAPCIFIKLHKVLLYLITLKTSRHSNKYFIGVWHYYIER
ncbi:hypothetical protein C0J52_19153 [Blattella germanica]|nr:hypothetical protein C0J52_19153 [Blattella germanica]